MALFAKDKIEIISAWEAIPNSIYTCVECGSPLKVRRGKLQFPHFYHLKTSPSCRLYSKSERHLLIQKQIQKLLPEGEGSLEKPFPSIHRIADLAWEKQNLVFEIQCSFISEKETKERILEYRSIGFDVVWILDDRIFNKKNLRPAEEKIRKTLSYFVTGKGPFFFYDQFEILQGKKRLKKSEKLFVDLTSPMHEISHTANPLQLQRKPIKRYFSGDLVDKTQTPGFEKRAAYWKTLELQALKTFSFKEIIKNFFGNSLKTFYLRLIERLLR